MKRKLTKTVLSVMLCLLFYSQRLPLIANAKDVSDDTLVSVSDDGSLTVKEDGYYTWCFKDGDSFYYTDGNCTPYESSSEIVQNWEELNSGDTLVHLVSGLNDVFVYYSEDSDTSVYDTANFQRDFTPKVVDSSDVSYMPTLSVISNCVKDNEELITVSISVADAAKDNGDNLAVFLVLDESNNEIISSCSYWKNGDTSATFDVSLTQNGKYTFRILDKFNNYCDESVVVDGLSSVVTDDTVSTDTEAPTIAYSGVPTSESDGVTSTLTVKTNEKCDIVINGVPYMGVDTADYTIYGNGTYTVDAEDMSGNTASVDIEVTTYSDTNDNTYDDANRDNFWDSSAISILPQTGGVAWYVLLGVGVALLVLSSLLLIRRFRIRAKEVKSNEEGSDTVETTLGRDLNEGGNRYEKEN